MGEVYRARDTRLGRDVAVKVLPDVFANDSDRLVRFTREAQTLASLNHPNIAHIHGLEESGHVRALVMELVEGDDLSQRIARGAVPLDEALHIARQIADALENAHEHGIVHRDLKPANIKVRADGTVKVLDFGLAKAMDPPAPIGAIAMNSPTLSVHATQAGSILGTAAYMSPEQAAGKPVDKRSDLWAFGVVVFEMLTGRPVFAGETASHILASVLKSDPDWTALPTGTPAPIRRLLHRCLDKDRKRRLADAADARLEIEEAQAAPSLLDDDDASPGAAASRRRPVALASAALLAGLVLASAATWALKRPAPAKPQPMRFAIVPPPAQPLAIAGFDRDLAISPDGTHLVYVSLGGQLMVRVIDQLEAVLIGGVTDARSPFFSPDGRWVGFFSGGASGGELKKVSIAGGPPLSLCRYSGAPRGASWRDDKIVFATAGRVSGLLRVSAAGGEPTVVTTLDAAPGRADHLFPSILPGGRAILFTIAGETTDTNQVAVLDLATGQRTILVHGGSQGEYVEPGYLVYAVAGALRAVRFDPATRTIGSDPVPVVEQVRTLPTGAAEFSVSGQGTLVYVPGGATGATRSLVWVTRQGKETAITAPPRAYVFPRLSPDGTRVALDIRDQDNDIWIADLARRTLTRLTDSPAPDIYPVWTPDGQRIIFGSARTGKSNLFWQAADNTGPVERLTTSPNPQFPTAIAPDGTRLIVRENVPTSGSELRLLRMQGRPEAVTAPPLALCPLQTEPFMQTTFNGTNGEVSPDGHWLAYQSNDSGRNQVFVRPFPNVEDGHWTISTNGGTRPVWARSGKELFYLDGTNALTAVSVHINPIFSVGTPTRLFEGRYYANEDGRTFDVSPDGEQFLMIKAIATEQASTLPGMVVVLNWGEDLKARVPPK